MITSFERARILWTLQGGSTGLNRIYSTCKHLGSPASKTEIKAAVDELIRCGEIQKQSHPLHENDFFYSLTTPEKSIV